MCLRAEAKKRVEMRQSFSMKSSSRAVIKTACAGKTGSDMAHCLKSQTKKAIKMVNKLDRRNEMMSRRLLKVETKIKNRIEHGKKKSSQSSSSSSSSAASSEASSVSSSASSL